MEKQNLSLIYENEEDDFIKSAIEYQERQIGMSRLRIEGLIKDLQNGIKEVRKLSPGVKKEKNPRNIKTGKVLVNKTKYKTEYDDMDEETLVRELEKTKRRIRELKREIREIKNKKNEKNRLPMGTKLIEAQQELGNKLEASKNEGKGVQGVSSPA